jgi:hypothetical protein
MAIERLCDGDEEVDNSWSSMPHREDFVKGNKVPTGIVCKGRRPALDGLEVAICLGVHRK